MKTVMSALVALAALAAVQSPAQALSPGDAGARQIERLAQSELVQKAAWSEQDQKDFWEQGQDRGG
ncbi:MAG TPA: hypothetical protein VG758_10980 [Hyphomicrobiaceae bacterium]|nr:hypothetical protein [Hyphomicrobiaceae bacterium]